MKTVLITFIVIISIFLIANVLSNISSYLVKNYNISGFYWVWLFTLPISAVSLLPFAFIPDFSFLQDSSGFVPLFVVDLIVIGFYSIILILLCIILYNYFPKSAVRN